MDDVRSTDLNAILMSKRVNVYYLEYCRVLVKSGRVEYVTNAGKQSLYWNIPIANTTSILLGTGTSITQAAVRELAKAGVMIGFCGGGGTPLFAAMEMDTPVAWLTPQSEYRPTGYLQQWVSFWFDDAKRLRAAKILQRVRLRLIEKVWLERGRAENRALDFSPLASEIREKLAELISEIDGCRDLVSLLTLEGRWTKTLYRWAATAARYGEFTRAKSGSGLDPANRYLDHGNYIAYGLGASAAWVLGLPAGLAVLHGKTRRGGLVFDLADIVKDSVVLPLAFASAAAGDEEQEFRRKLVSDLMSVGAIDVMIDTVKAILDELGASL